MSKKFSYQSDEYDRQAQRFVIPLYIKDNLENYQYSSTGTFVKYNEHYYMIFAAHALENTLDVNKIHTFSNDGTLYQILEHSIGYKIFQNEDIVIIDYFNNAFNGKNYFNFNLNSLLGFDKKHFAWTGFPISKTKAKIIHKTKSKETLKKEHIHSDDDAIYFKNAKYFTILSRLINQKKTLDDTFRFAGIGLEYKDNKTIIGISRNKIIEIINIFKKKNPVELIFQEQNNLKT